MVKKRGSSPRVSKGVKRCARRADGASALPAMRDALRDACWAVIGDHYVALDLTYEEARADAEQLKAKKQPGVVIVVTNAAAERMIMGADFGVGVASLPDVKF
jgi:hypothetical protein